MPRTRDGFVPLGDVSQAVALPGDRALTHRADASPARRPFTRLDQVTQLVQASEADPEVGFMARLLALCSLPRTNPGNRLQYVRRNGPVHALHERHGWREAALRQHSPLNRPWARAFLVAQETHGLPLGRGSLCRYTQLIGCGRSR